MPKKYPDMKVSLYLGEADTLLTWLQEGRIQCCLTNAYCLFLCHEGEELFEVETILSVPRSILLPAKRWIFQDLNAYRLIFRENDTNSHRNLMHILQAHNQELGNFQSYIEIGTINAVKKLVMENMGISFYLSFCRTGKFR